MTRRRGRHRLDVLPAGRAGRRARHPGRAAAGRHRRHVVRRGRPRRRRPTRRRGAAHAGSRSPPRGPAPAAFLDGLPRGRRAQAATAVVSVHLSAQMSGTRRVGAAGGQGLAGAGRGGRLRARSGMGLGFAVVSAAAGRGRGRPTLDEVAAVGDGARARRRRRCSTWTPSSTCGAVGGSAPAAALARVGAGGEAVAAPRRRAHRAAGEGAHVGARRSPGSRRSPSSELPGQPHRSMSPCTTWPARSAPSRSPTGCATGSRAWTTCYVSEVGAVVGAHVGPGMLAVVVAPR